MKKGDMVYNDKTGKSGQIVSDFFYHFKGKMVWIEGLDWAVKGLIPVLACRVKYLCEPDIIVTEVEDLTVEFDGEIVEYSKVQISSASPHYYRMYGSVLKIVNSQVWVVLDGYKYPIPFHSRFVEPLTNCALLEAWIDSL